MSKSKDRARSPKHPKGTDGGERSASAPDARSDEERRAKAGPGEAEHKHAKRFGHN